MHTANRSVGRPSQNDREDRQNEEYDVHHSEFHRLVEYWFVAGDGGFVECRQLVHGTARRGKAKFGLIKNDGISTHAGCIGEGEGIASRACKDAVQALFLGVTLVRGFWRCTFTHSAIWRLAQPAILSTAWCHQSQKQGEYTNRRETFHGGSGD